MHVTPRAGLISLAATGGLLLSLGAPAAAGPQAPPPLAPAPTAAVGPASEKVAPDDSVGPLEQKRRALRESALTSVVNGEAAVERRGSSDVVKVGQEQASAAASAAGADAPDAPPQDQFVELSREGTDRIFVVLAEFGDQRDPAYPDKDIDPATPGPTTFEGPEHNAIPEPGADDNTTVWQEDFGQEHFQDLYFGRDGDTESVAEYYETQSSGRYSVSGEVTDWVKVPYNEARYGRSSDPNEGGEGDDPNVCGDVVCDNVQNLVSDSVAAWEAGQREAGRTPEQIAEELRTFDVQDRYDFDGDGDFDEADGYIDHFQVVHAGGDESDGDPQQGEDAIWAHRSYAFSGDEGRTGPAGNLLGGTQIGTSGLWVGDYTMQPENGGMSVFAHEYGHDLGLPDHYDTAGGDNGVEYWNLMAQSRLGAEGEALGTRAGDLSAWDKLQLGWLDYETVVAGQERTIDLGPHEYNSAKPQAVAVVLPDKEVTTELGGPDAGEGQYWSGSGDDLSNTLTAPVDLTGVTTSTLSMRSRYDIETDYDYLYVQASTDGGATWTSLPGTVGGQPFGQDGADSPALTGAQEDWADVSVDLSAYAGSEAQVRLLYRTDGGEAPPGFFADDITLTNDGEAVLVDGAEEGATSPFTAEGFSAQGASTTELYDNYYLASNRSFVEQDRYLETGPYNYGDAEARPDFAEHFAYEQGLLVTYWDTSQSDNNTSEHPGAGLVLPVDAHPAPIANLQGELWRSRIQVYDAPFSLNRAGSFELGVNGQPSLIRGQDAVPVFDDSRSYWSPELPGSSVQVPEAGVRMEVLSQEGTSMQVRID